MALILPTTTITTAVTGVTPGPVVQLRSVPLSVIAQGNFVYGSGGTTAKVWLQTSLDGGTTWCDAIFLSFTTSTSRLVASVISDTAYASAAATDGSASAQNSGLVGTLWRAKLTTTGTYAGGTTITVNMVASGLTAQ